METSEDLRRKRDEYRAEVRKLRELIEAAELLIRDIDRRLREREQTNRRLELSEAERIPDRSATTNREGMHTFHQAGWHQTSRPLSMEESGLRITTRPWRR
jgi:hypothetical protein